MEKLVPRLRFPGFEGNWNSQLLEEMAKRGSGHTPNKSFAEYYLGNIPWISLADSKRLDNGYIERTTYKISSEGITNSSAVVHSAESVLLSRDAGVGKSAVMKTEMAVSQHFIVWFGNEGQLSNWYLYYQLQILQPEFERIAIGNTIKTIGLPYFKKLKLIIPRYNEQEKIASFFKKLDEKLNHLKKKKTLLEKYKKGMMQKIFNQEIRFKDEGGKEFGEWETKLLKDVFYSEKGQGLSKDKLKVKGAYKCILYGELYTKYNEVISNVVSQTDINEGLQSKKGDLLIPASTTTTGIDLANITALNEDGVLLGGDITVLRPVSYQINNIFYAYYLSNHRKYEIASYAQGITIVHLYFSHIKEMAIDVPEFKEQTKIAKFLSAIDNKINLVGKEIEGMEKWKKGLLGEMFV